jgi:alkylation response protein AidB-like acyl-CoA dehydrogenase
MALILTEEQSMLRDSARDFLSEQAPVSQLRALRDSADASGYSRDLWAQFASMGFTGVLVPEAHGGLGLGQVEAGVLMHQIGRQLCASPLLASGLVAATALMQAGSTEQQQRWLPAIAAGQLIATLAVDETAHHHPQTFTTRARQEGANWLIDGNKTLVLDGHVADALIAVAADADGTPGLYWVEAKAPGVLIERTVMVDAHNAARVVLQGAPAQRLGLAGSHALALQTTLDVGRCAVAAELMGLADEVFERTVQYLQDRKQFGKAIGEFQALQHRAASLYAELQIGHAALIHAQQLLDAGDAAKAHAAVAVAKARAGRTATLAVQEGVQMHGGMGMTDAFEIGFFMKRARVLNVLWGDANQHLDAFARLRGY